jgi:hypothetical protein
VPPDAARGMRGVGAGSLLAPLARPLLVEHWRLPGPGSRWPGGCGRGIMKPSNLRTSRLILETRDAQAARGTVD